MKVQNTTTSAQTLPGIDKTLLDQWAIKDNKILQQAAQKAYRPQARSQNLQDEMSNPFHSTNNEHFMGNDYY